MFYCQIAMADPEFEPEEIFFQRSNTVALDEYVTRLAQEKIDDLEIERLIRIDHAYDNQGLSCLTRKLNPLTEVALEYCAGLMPDTYEVYEL